MSEFTDELTAGLENAGFDADLAADAAERAAALRDDYEEAAPDVDGLLDRVAAAPYDDPERQWNWAVGDVCASLDDCTDSRDYRLGVFGDVGPLGKA